MKVASALALVLLCGASCAWATAFGQALRDPMEPPPSMRQAPAAGGAAGTGQAVQSIIVSNGRRLALIDGTRYQVGDKLGDATVVSITANEVVVRGPSGTKALKLYPNLDKIVAGTKDSAPAPPKGRQ